MHFIVSGLIFKLLIHFELILMCGDRQQSSFILLQEAWTETGFYDFDLKGKGNKSKNK